MIDKRVSNIKISIREIQQMAKGCIRFDIGQPDFKVPDHIKETAKKALDDDFIIYTHTRGVFELRQEIAKYESEKGRKFSEENIIVTDGTMGALSNFFLALEPNSEVIILKPYFPPYIALLAIARCKPVVCDFEDFDSKINSKTSCIVVNSPRNPDGKVFNTNEIKHIAEVADKHNIAVLSDEVYDRMVYDVEAQSVSEYYHKTFIANSLSKTQAMTGFRVGWLVGPEEDIKHIAKVNGTINASVNSISQMVALEALRGSQEHVESMKKQYHSRRDLMMMRIDELGWTYTNPDGALYIFPKTGKDSWSFAKKLIREAKVATVPGDAFGCENHLRFCFGSVSEEEIANGFDRIKKVI